MHQAKDIAIMENVKGVVIPSMPDIEWADENLCGFSGTPYYGRWYYTYQQAVDSIRELGHGWRLPTRYEVSHLFEAGFMLFDFEQVSENGVICGRLGGENVIFPAQGFFHTVANHVVGADKRGFYWVQDDNTELPGNASCLVFCKESGSFSISVLAMEHMLSVRPVRDISK